MYIGNLPGQQGTQSIAAFCAKYGALYRYEMAEGWITLRVVL